MLERDTVRRQDFLTARSLVEQHMSEATQLSILMATVRFDDTARAALAAAAATGCSDISVHIGDNSENKEKHAFLRHLANTNKNVFVYCHEKNLGMEANSLFLIDAQNSPFISFAADDDIFASPYFIRGLDLIANRDDCGAASGLFIGTTYRDTLPHPYLMPALSRVETSALDRIKAYRGINTMAYAVVRSEIILKYFKYIQLNPLKAGFVDYLLAFHILSASVYIVDQASYVYVYNNNNWAFADSGWQSGAKFYQASGLPNVFQYFDRLHWAVANLHFFSSTFRSPNLSQTEANEIATYLFFRYLDEFRHEYAANKVPIDAVLAPSQVAVESLKYLLNVKTTSDPDIYRQFIILVASFSYELGVRYRNFLSATLRAAA